MFNSKLWHDFFSHKYFFYLTFPPLSSQLKKWTVTLSGKLIKPQVKLGVKVHSTVPFHCFIPPIPDSPFPCAIFYPTQPLTVVKWKTVYGIFNEKQEVYQNTTFRCLIKNPQTFRFILLVVTTIGRYSALLFDTAS